MTVLETRMGALGSPSEVSGLLSAAHADKMVAVSRQRETQEQLEQSQASVQALQSRVRAADADKQKLLDAFTQERSQRELEALASRRVLETRLEEAVGLGSRGLRS